MVMANTLAVELGLLDPSEVEAIEKLLIDNSLPTRYEIEDIDSFYDHFFLDKKSAGGKIKFILPGGKIGTHRIVDDIDEESVKKALKIYNGS
jgi:3-dehydroquinate synthase